MAEIGYLLVGHGTRRPEGREQFRTVFSHFRKLLVPAPATLAFLELAEPDIPAGVEELHKQGVKRVVVVPCLLFSAGHAEEDIPLAVHQACNQLDMQVLAQSSPLGLAEPVLRLSAWRFRQAVCRTSSAGLTCKESCDGRFCQSTSLVMVGRGSNSASATEEMRRFSRHRQAFTATATCQTAFIHGQSPRVMDALHQAGRDEHGRVVVQPHLLFEGLLSRELAQQVQTMRDLYGHKEWVLVDVLGCDEQLPNCLAEIANGAATAAASNLP